MHCGSSSVPAAAMQGPNSSGQPALPAWWASGGGDARIAPRLPHPPVRQQGPNSSGPAAAREGPNSSGPAAAAHGASSCGQAPVGAPVPGRSSSSGQTPGHSETVEDASVPGCRFRRWGTAGDSQLQRELAAERRVADLQRQLDAERLRWAVERMELQNLCLTCYRAGKQGEPMPKC